MTIIRAIPASPGIAVEKAHVLSHLVLDVPRYFIQSHKVSDEQQRFMSVLRLVSNDLNEIRRKGGSKLTNEILEAYLLIVNDVAFHEKVASTIEKHMHNAEWAVHKVMRSYVQKLRESQDEQLRERTKDLHDIMMRLISTLKNSPVYSPGAEIDDCILVARSLFPSQLLQYPKEKIRGIILEHGGKTSHVSIIARAFGIPLVVNASGIIDAVTENDIIILDAHAGEVQIQADTERVEQYKQTARSECEKLQQLEDKASELKHITADEQPLLFEVNIDVLEELETSACKFSDGIGLFRTEFFLTDTSLHHSSKYQYEVYSKLLKSMGGRPVTIRTMDMGGDKLPFAFQQLEEENPLLGYRGARFALGHRELFFEQLQTLIRSSVHGNLHVLIPMISTVEELLETKEMYTQAFESVKHELPEGAGLPEFGVMLEVPSLLYMLEDIAPYCDFWSIGTNDLLQYTLASDRSNSSIAYLYSYFQPAFLRVLRDIFHRAFQLKVPVAMCGEMASDIQSIALLLGAGLRHFSVAPSQLPAVIDYATSLKISDARTLFEHAVTQVSVEKVRSAVEEFFAQ